MQPFERMDVYRVAVEFDEVVIGALRGRRGTDVDQLDRACGAVLRNLAEGATERAPAEKARLFRLALREAAECNSTLDRLHRKAPLPALQYARARSLIGRVQRMLLRLSTNFAART